MNLPPLRKDESRPLPDQISDILREKIEQGEYPPGKKLFHFTNTPLFLKRGEGFGERRKTFFLVKKSFSPLPDAHLPLSGTARF